MKKFTRFFALAAILLLCAFSVAGCGKKNSAMEFDKNTVYSETLIDIPFEKGFEPNSLIINQDRIYFCGYVYDENTYELTNKWGYVNTDGSSYTDFKLDAKDGWLDSLLVLNDGNVVVVYSDYFEDNSDPENPDWYANLYLSLYDKDGNFVKNVNLTQDYEIDWLNSSCIIDDNSFMVNAGSKTIFFDSSLNVVREADTDESDSIYSLYKLRNGKLFTYYWGDNGTVYKYYDPSTNALGDEIDVSKINITNFTIMQGNSKWDMFLLDSMGVYGYNLGDNAPTQIMNYVNSDASSSSFTSIASISEDEFLGAFYDWSDDSARIKVAKYKKVDPSQIKDKQTISLGCLYIDDTVRKNVIKFNKTNDKYRIVITDYSIYETEDDWMAGQEKFNSDIASGQGPDIIVSEGDSLAKYASKGLFVDLLPMIESDSEISKDNLFPNLIEACSYDGKMFEITPEFYISTVAGKTSLLGDKKSWTFDEFNAFRKSLPAGMDIFSDMSRSSVMYSILYSDASEYVDMQKGTCSFDSDEFIKLLEFLKELPEDIEGDDELYYDDMMMDDEASAFRENKAALYMTNIYSIREYNSMVKGTFGEDVTLIGFPAKEGNGSTLFYGTSYAISSKCKDPQAAWEVIRYYLTPEYQKQVGYGIPATISRFDELAEEAKQKPYYMDGDKKIEYDDTFWINGQSVPIEPITDAEINALKDFIASVTKTSGDLGDIETIVEEETAAFFEGQKTAADVCKIIQSRASIYLKEIQ